MKMTAGRILRLSPYVASALVLGLIASGCSGCEKKPDPTATPTPLTSASTGATAEAGDAQAARPVGVKLDKITRGDFNRLAAELALPLFWAEDKNKDGAIDPDELAVYWGLVPGAKLAEYVTKEGFTAKAQDAIDTIVKRAKDPAPPAGLDTKELARREAVKKELAQGRITLVETDLSKASAEEKRFVGFITDAAVLIEALYAKQEGRWPRTPASFWPR